MAKTENKNDSVTRFGEKKSPLAKCEDILAILNG